MTHDEPEIEATRMNQMILLAAEGWSNEAIARSLRTRREVVSLWRKRFFEDRLAGLEDHLRSGRPRAFSPRGRRHHESPRV